ncbi:MAG: hypothetical protein LBH11_00670, partial [Propionibacteriaceae bacterium]|nr:hypothetical protein [Propionibacteriaceae bacterium]
APVVGLVCRELPGECWWGAFWYGFVQAVVEQVTGMNPALLLEMQPGIRKALATVQQPLPAVLF